MNIFSKLMSGIFHHAPETPKAAPVEPITAPVSPTGEPAAGAVGAMAGTVPGDAAPKAEAPVEVDVAAILDKLKAEHHGEDLDWKKSIVDLMKLVGMESSLSERKELADELGYTGDKSDSASMNVWLHKAVLQKLQENGGKVPADLLD